MRIRETIRMPLPQREMIPKNEMGGPAGPPVHFEADRAT
jgi:hypothetical protein